MDVDVLNEPKPNSSAITSMSRIGRGTLARRRVKAVVEVGLAPAQKWPSPVDSIATATSCPATFNSRGLPESPVQTPPCPVASTLPWSLSTAGSSAWNGDVDTRRGGDVEIDPAAGLGGADGLIRPSSISAITPAAEANRTLRKTRRNATWEPPAKTDRYAQASHTSAYRVWLASKPSHASAP